MFFLTVSATGRPSWEELVSPTFSSTSVLRAEEAATFFTGKVCGAQAFGGFQSQPSEAREFLCWRWQGLSGCAQPVSRPLRSAGKMPTVFIFHLSLQEVKGGLGRERGASQPGPSSTSEQRRSTSGVPHFHLCLLSPALGPFPASIQLKKRRACCVPQ